MTERVFDTLRRGVYVRRLIPRSSSAGSQSHGQSAVIAKNWSPITVVATTQSQRALPPNNFRGGLVLQSPSNAADIVDIGFDEDAAVDKGMELAIGGTVIIDAQTVGGNAVYLRARSGSVKVKIIEVT